MSSSKGLLVALAGNPNTGKSTVFNALTGLRQHTGNWPGKTVTLAQGQFSWRGLRFTLVDLPGTYSLFPNSPDEEVTRDFICFERPAATVVVADATCLERNLNLVLQVLELTPNVVVCVNLMDEARRLALEVDTGLLARELAVPVVPCAARRGEGLEELKEAILDVATGRTVPKPRRITYSVEVEAAVAHLMPFLAPLAGRFNPRWLALRLLENDKALLARLGSPVAGGASSELRLSLEARRVGVWLN
jgi:Fe2+ transport system protein B